MSPNLRYNAHVIQYIFQDGRHELKKFITSLSLIRKETRLVHQTACLRHQEYNKTQHTFIRYQFIKFIQSLDNINDNYIV